MINTRPPQHHYVVAAVARVAKKREYVGRMHSLDLVFRGDDNLAVGVGLPPMFPFHFTTTTCRLFHCMHSFATH